MTIWNYRQLKLRKVVYTIAMIDDNDDQGDIDSENDLGTKLNVSGAGSSSSSCCGSATFSITQPAGNTTAIDIAQTPYISSCTS